MKRWNGWKGGLLTIRAAAVMLMFLTVGLGAPRSVVADDPPSGCEEYHLQKCASQGQCDLYGGDPCGADAGEQCAEEGWKACGNNDFGWCASRLSLICQFEEGGGEPD